MQRTDTDTKVTGEFSIKGRLLPPDAQNGFLLFPSFLVKKYTKLIGHISSVPKKKDKKGKLPPLDHGGPEMKYE